MALRERISADTKEAMKAKETARLSTLRLISAAIKDREIAARTEGGEQGGLSEADLIAILSKMVKQRQEAAEQYRAGGAADRADRELEEARFLQGYLPEQLSDEELESLTRRVAQDTGAASPKDLGKVMGRVMPLVKGRAEGNRVRAAALKVLGS